MVMRKSVRWSTITVYEFGVGIGGSSVPKRGGPAVGLAKKPTHIWSTTVDQVKDSLRAINGHADGCDPSGKTRVTVEATDSDNMDGNISQQLPSSPRRYRRVRWLKPLERINMLEKAGYSERKIYRMLMESSKIAMSRRLCLRLPVDASGSSASPVRHH